VDVCAVTEKLLGNSVSSPASLSIGSFWFRYCICGRKYDRFSARVHRQHQHQSPLYGLPRSSMHYGVHKVMAPAPEIHQLLPPHPHVPKGSEEQHYQCGTKRTAILAPRRAHCTTRKMLLRRRTPPSIKKKALLRRRSQEHWEKSSARWLASQQWGRRAAASRTAAESVALNRTAPSQQWGRRAAASRTAADIVALNRTAPSQQWGRRADASRTAADIVALNRTAPSHSSGGDGPLRRARRQKA
jgi:hypothetical protein